MRVVFWQDALSFHQYAHISAMAKFPGVEVKWIASEKTAPGREAQGWPVLLDPNVDVVVAPSDDVIHSICHEMGEGDVHIVTGIRNFAMSLKVLQIAGPTKATIGMQIENRDTPGARGYLRKLAYAVDYLRFGRRIDFVLVMGFCEPHGGAVWLQGRGYKADRLFPYGYFPPTPELPSDDIVDDTPDRPFRFLYIGQMIPRKNLSVLVRALAPLKGLNWELDLIGSGAEQEALGALVTDCGLSEKVHFLGNQPNEDATGRLHKCDTLLLPSVFDGWGATVSEATLRGVPVICSTRCGSKDLLFTEEQGTTFEATDVHGLTIALKKHVDGGIVPLEKRVRLAQRGRLATGDTAAKYLTDIIAYSQGKVNRPSAPWLLA